MNKKSRSKKIYNFLKLKLRSKPKEEQREKRREERRERAENERGFRVHNDRRQNDGKRDRAREEKEK